MALRQGFGACCFLQWEDTQEITTLNDIADESKHELYTKSIYAKSTSRRRLLDSDLGDLSIENPKRMKFDSLEMENPQHFPTVAAVPELYGKEQEAIMESGECDETSDKNPSKCIDESQVESTSNLQGLVMLEAESRSPIMKKSILISHPLSQAETHRRQAEFWRQITAAGDTSTTGISLCTWVQTISYSYGQK